jgi:hypothetical protein
LAFLLAFMSSLILSVISFSRWANICSISIMCLYAPRCDRKSNNLISLIQSIPLLTPAVTCIID